MARLATNYTLSDCEKKELGSLVCSPNADREIGAPRERQSPDWQKPQQETLNRKPQH